MPLTADELKERVDNAMAALNAPGAAPDITKQVIKQINDSQGLDADDKKVLINMIRDEWAKQQADFAIAVINSPGVVPDMARQVMQRIKDSPDIEEGAKARLVSDVRLGWIKQQAQHALAVINAPGAAPDVAKQLLQQIQESPHVDEADKIKLIGDIRVQWVEQQTPALVEKAGGPGGMVQACQDILSSPDYRPEDKQQLIGALVHAKIDSAQDQALKNNASLPDPRQTEDVSNEAARAALDSVLREIQEDQGLDAQQKRELQAQVIAGAILLERAPAVQNDMGKNIFAAINECDALSEDAKVQLCCDAVAEVTRHECMAAGNQPHTLMRGNNVGTNFMSAYMNEHAADYFNAVKNAGLQAAQQAPQHTQDPVQQEFIAAAAVMGAMTSQAGLMDGPASKFVQASCQVVQAVMPAGQVEAGIQKVMANTIALRGICPKIAGESGVAKGNRNLPAEERAANNLLYKASRGVQQYANLRGQGEPMGNKAACYDLIAEDEELGQEFANTLELMAEGHQFEAAAVLPQAPVFAPDVPSEGPAQQGPAGEGLAQQGPAGGGRLSRVRDTIFGVAKNAKDGIKAKLDQAKLNQLQKHYDKRAAHGELLADRKQIADHIAGMSPEAKGRMMANLQAEYDPGKLLKGDREQRARQMQIAEQIDMCKMSPEALEALSDKLQQRIDRNEPKMEAAERKRDAQKAKVDLRAARREQGQNQGHGARVG